jgi:hypothetical protein
VRTKFGPNDVAAFEEARDDLLTRLALTRPSEGRRGFDAQLALDWKWAYGGGDLGLWRLEDLDEFLLEWCPRKVAMPPDESRKLPVALSDLLGFLADNGILARGSASIDRLQRHLAGMGDLVAAAMGEPSGFGLGKSILSAFSGPDIFGDDLDPDALQMLQDRFNALPFEERGRILGLGGPALSPWSALTAGIPFPPPPATGAEALTVQAEATAFVRQVGILRAFVGGGRKLTAKGNLTVADAKVLAATLEDPRVAMGAKYGFSVRSADDFPEMQFVIRWARAAGAVRVAKGKLLVTASWAKLGPVEAVSRAVAVLLEKGPLSLWTANSYWAPEALIQVIDEGAVPLLALLWAAPEAMDFEELLEAIVEICEPQLRFPATFTPDLRRIQIRSEVDRFFDVLAAAGVVERLDADQSTDRHGSTSREGGVMSLTPLGRAVLGDRLRAGGYDVPMSAELADGPLAALFDQIGRWLPDRIRTEFDWWVQRHSVEAAVDGLATVMMDYEDPQWAVAAFELVERLGTADAERAVRRLLVTPARGHAIVWLLDHDYPDVPEDRPAMLRSGLELLATRADDADEDFLALIAGIDDLATLIEEAGQVSGPAAFQVLESIAHVHPDPVIARSARKAAMRGRSR